MRRWSNKSQETSVETMKQASCGKDFRSLYNLWLWSWKTSQDALTLERALPCSRPAKVKSQLRGRLRHSCLNVARSSRTVSDVATTDRTLAIAAEDDTKSRQYNMLALLRKLKVDFNLFDFRMTSASFSIVLLVSFSLCFLSHLQHAAVCTWWQWVSV